METQSPTSLNCPGQQPRATVPTFRASTSVHAVHASPMESGHKVRVTPDLLCAGAWCYNSHGMRPRLVNGRMAPWPCHTHCSPPGRLPPAPARFERSLCLAHRVTARSLRHHCQPRGNLKTAADNTVIALHFDIASPDFSGQNYHAPPLIDGGARVGGGRHAANGMQLPGGASTHFTPSACGAGYLDLSRSEGVAVRHITVTCTCTTTHAWRYLCTRSHRMHRTHPAQACSLRRLALPTSARRPAQSGARCRSGG